MPAAKKHVSTRARANRAATAATLPAAPRAGKAPELPHGRPWHAMTRAWWRALWSAPMSAEYHESDVHQLYLLAVLMDDFYRAESPTMRKDLASEIRHHRAAFGSTPYDRRRLEWTIEAADEAKDRGKRRRDSAQPPVRPAKAAADPRSVLRAV